MIFSCYPFINNMLLVRKSQLNRAEGWRSSEILLLILIDQTISLRSRCWNFSDATLTPAGRLCVLQVPPRLLIGGFWLVQRVLKMWAPCWFFEGFCHILLTLMEAVSWEAWECSKCALNIWVCAGFCIFLTCGTGQYLWKNVYLLFAVGVVTDFYGWREGWLETEPDVGICKSSCETAPPSGQILYRLFFLYVHFALKI